MTFAYPFVALGALVVAIAFAALAWAAERRTRAAALDYSQLAFLEAVAGRTPWSLAFAGVWTAAILLLGLALARPSVQAVLPVHDGAVVLCIDTSGSMASADVDPSRADAARAAAATFIATVPAGTRIGVVAFSASAIPLGSLTDDRATATDELGRIPPPNGGTAIGDALAAAADLLPSAGRRAIVLVTDGVNNAGRDPLEAAQTIGASGVAIFTVGIGTNGSGQLIPGTGESAEIDEDALRQIAAAGNGTYARVGDAGELRSRLAALAQTTVRERRHVDLALPAAIAGGVLGTLATIVALALGRFP
jgi:Ca-activated chloride channel family protein